MPGTAESSQFTNRNPANTGSYTETGRIGSKVFFRIDQTFSFSDGDTADNFDHQLPAYGVIETLRARADTAVTGTTGTHLAVGISGDVDEFAEIPITDIDADDDSIVYHTTDPVGTALTGAGSAQTISSSAQTVQVAISDGSGSAAGSIDTGVIHIALEGYYIEPVAVAAS